MLIRLRFRALWRALWRVSWQACLLALFLGLSAIGVTAALEYSHYAVYLPLVQR